MLLYIYNKDASFLFKERFFETTLNDEFQKFWEKKKRKNPVVSHLACTTGFFRLLFKFIISSPRFTSRSSLPS